jgi:hypothetical protein
MTVPSSLRLFGLCGLVLASFQLVLVLERAGAALFKAYKFGFDGASPIILNRETVLFFFVVATVFLVICLLGILVSKKQDPCAEKLFRASVALNITGAVIVTLLLVSSFARMSP